jgi:hypothetical protein
MQQLVKKLMVLFSFLFVPLIASEVSYLAEKVAAGNDWLINKGEKTPLLKPFTLITSRTMSLTLFPLSTAVDITVLAANKPLILY